MCLVQLAKLKKIAVIYTNNIFMKNSLNKVVKRLLFLMGIILFIPLSFSLFIQLTDYTPAKIEDLSIKYGKQLSVEDQEEFTVLSWNLGYCGLGKEMDFFYDGGKQVRSTEALAEKYLSENLSFIQSLDSIDFFIFQEIDKKAKRSYFIDQAEKINTILPSYHSIFTKNYKVPFVPIPLLNPLGGVEAGMMTFSRFTPVEASRYAYPNIATWPNNLFLLDRCFILSRFDLPSGKEIVLINTHNSYYVKGDSLRMIELNILKNKMLQEYEKGNYVVVGGDWNKFPPYFHEKSSLSSDLLQADIQALDLNYLPSDWAYAFDSEIPSNRELREAYLKGKTKVSGIDFFVVSPNVKIKNCKAHSLDFANSDHNPIQLRFLLDK